MPSIKFKKLSETAISPSVGSEKAACFDLYASENQNFLPGAIALVKTGWAVEPSDGYRVNLYVRSSTPLKRGLMLANGVGIIDEDYRGELAIQLFNASQDSVMVAIGDKIAQIELVPSNVARSITVEYVDELSETKRGDGGLGSTGL